MIGAVLLGNTLVDVLAASLASGLAVHLVRPGRRRLRDGDRDLLIVIFAAVLPKTYALAFPDSVALFIAPLMRVIIALLQPFTTAIEFIVRQILKLTPIEARRRRPTSSPRTRRSAAPSSSDHRRRGCQAATRPCSAACSICASLQVLDIMVHRTKMQTRSTSDDPPEKVVDEVLKSQYTRIPLWKDEPENIVGGAAHQGPAGRAGRAPTGTCPSSTS